MLCFAATRREREFKHQTIAGLGVTERERDREDNVPIAFGYFIPRRVCVVSVVCRVISKQTRSAPFRNGVTAQRTLAVTSRAAVDKRTRVPNVVSVNRESVCRRSAGRLRRRAIPARCENRGNPHARAISRCAEAWNFGTAPAGPFKPPGACPLSLRCTRACNGAPETPPAI